MKTVSEISKRAVNKEFSNEFSLSGLIRYINRANEIDQPNTVKYLQKLGFEPAKFTLKDLFFVSGKNEFYHVRKDGTAGKLRTRFSMYWFMQVCPLPK